MMMNENGKREIQFPLAGGLERKRELQHLSFLRKGRRSLTLKHKKLPPDVGVPQKFRFLLIWLLFGFYDKQ